MRKTVLCATAIIGLASGALRVHAAPSGPCLLCGTWVLIDRVDRTPDGRVIAEPTLGSDPLGIIVYDAAGNVAAQLMKRNRDGGSAPAPAAQTVGANNSAPTNGYDAYFGTYSVDPAAHTVTHRLVGAISPGDVGKSVTRNFEFVGGELHLRFRTTNGGVEVLRTLRWKRATQPPDARPTD